MALVRSYINPMRALVLLTGVLALLFAYAPRAHSWEVCNETSYIMRVATATTIEGELIPKGWSRARPGQCLSIDAAPNTPRYVYAESTPAYQGGIREWKGNHTLCAAPDDFESNTNVTCALQGLESRSYLAVDPSQLKTSLIEAQGYGSKAVTAGIQRLLRDLGYRVPNIDGQKGRQTNRAMTKFLNDNDLAKTLDDAARLDALEAAALKRQDEIGIAICNETEGKIWTAIAYREGASWESRGWWAIDAAQCLRPHTQSIKAFDAHIFALKEVEGEEDHILKSAAAVPSQFCIAESRFAVLGRENCKARGYAPASFRPLPNDKDGVTIRVSPNDFAPRKKGGLRQ